MFVLRMKRCVCDTSKREVGGSYEKKGVFVIREKRVFVIRVKGCLSYA